MQGMMGIPVKTALRDKRQVATVRACDAYQQLDLGPGGYALAPSTETRRGIQEALRRRMPLSSPRPNR
jgi:hypothetical protein